MGAPVELGRDEAKVAKAIEARTRRFVLANGLEVLAVSDPRATRAHVELILHVGYASERASQRGLAHLFEHAAFVGGSRTIDVDEHTRLVEHAGGWANARTFATHMRFVQQAPAGTLNLLLWLERERMLAPLGGLDRTLLDRETAAVVSEGKIVTDTSHGQLLLARYEAVFGEGTGASVAATDETLRSLEVADVRGFARRHYRPDNATLTISAPSSLDEIESGVRDLFEAIPSSRTPLERGIDRRKSPRGCRRRASPAPVEENHALFIWPAPASTQEESLALDVLFTATGRGQQAAMSKRLVSEGLARSATLLHESDPSGGFVMLDVVPEAGVASDRLAMKVEAAREEFLGGEALDPQALTRELRSRRREAFWSLTEGKRLLRAILDASPHGDPEAFLRTTRRVSHLTREQLLSSARQWLGPHPCIVELVASPRGAGAP